MGSWLYFNCDLWLFRTLSLLPTHLPSLPGWTANGYNFLLWGLCHQKGIFISHCHLGIAILGKLINMSTPFYLNVSCSGLFCACDWVSRWRNREKCRERGHSYPTTSLLLSEKDDPQGRWHWGPDLSVYFLGSNASLPSRHLLENLSGTAWPRQASLFPAVNWESWYQPHRVLKTRKAEVPRAR